MQQEMYWQSGRQSCWIGICQAKQSLALLEYDLQGPSPGIDLIGLEEAKSQVSAKQPAPRATLSWRVPWRSCQSFLSCPSPQGWQSQEASGLLHP